MWAEVALAFAAAVASFTLVAVILAAGESGVVAVLLAVVIVVVVLVIAHYWGASYAIPILVAALVGFDWFQFPPTHEEEFPDTENLLGLLAYFVVGTFAGELASYSVRRAAISEAARTELADEQAALRRVATVVARGAPRADVFRVIAQESARLLLVEELWMLRYETDHRATVVASSRETDLFRVGSTHDLGGDNVTSIVQQTGEATRIDDPHELSGPIGEIAGSLRIRSVVGTPVVVQDRLWGVMVAATTRNEPLAADTETRFGQFTDLMATAIANAEARAEVTRLADQQAALRRVATLVATEAEPAEIFAKVASETAIGFGRVECVLMRDELDGTARVVGVDGAGVSSGFPLGARIPLEGAGVTERVVREGRPRRIDDYQREPQSLAEGARERGIASAVGCPIVVGERTWGAIVVATFGPDGPLPPETETRLAQFADLVATAIANAASRDELDASRARLVTEADEARRRVVRDLHDGAQQRLVHSIITLKLAKQALRDQEGEAAGLVNEAIEQAEAGNAELRELAHGLLPPVLTRGGLKAGVDSVVSRLDLPVDVDITSERLPAEIEASAYFIVAEALTNVVKHAHARHVEVKVSANDGLLQVEIHDDGVGGADPDGHGLVGLDDRATALGGRLDVESPPSGGTTLTATFPL
jgi:signal transduction histidine kinase